jgi:hypothetical protein
VFYDPRTHGTRELAIVQGDDTLHPVQIVGARPTAVLMTALEETERSKKFDARSMQDARTNVEFRQDLTHLTQ